MITPWRLAWLGLALLVIGVEMYALLSPAPGDTLSEQVIPFLLAIPALWLGALVIWLAWVAWLTWHFWFQYRGRDE